jgi:competence protein ComEA
MELVNRAFQFLLGLLVGLVAIGLLQIVSSKPIGQPVELRPAPSPGPLRVYVSGAVAEPGVYLFPQNAIIEDALQAAGGWLESAELGTLNLAAPLKDGQQIYLPSKEEGGPTPPALRSQSTGDTPLINVNTADVTQLEELPGIGPTLATKIVDFRNAHGPFKTTDDLLLVSGIGPAKLNEIRDLIIVR